MDKSPEGAAIAAMMQSVVRALPYPALVIALDDTVLACNEPAARLLGLPEERIVGSAFRDLDVSFKIPRLRVAIENTKIGGPAVDLATTSAHSDGTTIALRATVAPLAQEDTRTGAVLVTLEDVTRVTDLEAAVSSLTRQLALTGDELQVANEELEVMNAELRSETVNLATRLEALDDTTRASSAATAIRLGQSEARFRALLRSSIIGVFVADAETIQESNAAFLGIIGSPVDEVAGGRLRWRDLTAPEHRNRDDRALQMLQDRGESPPYEKELVRPDGSRVPVLVGGTLLSSTPLSWVCFVIDLTERRRLERCRDAEHAVARILATAHLREEAVPRILEALCRSLEWEVGELWEVDARSERAHRAAVWSEPDLANTEFAEAGAPIGLASGEGLPGQVWALGRALLLEDLPASRIVRAAAAVSAGLVAGLGVPIAFGGVVIGVMTFFRRRHEPPDDDLLRTLEAIGSQIGQFLVRWHSEEALALSERKARALLEQAAEGIVVIDTGGRIEMVNAKVEAMFGYTREELIGQTLEVLLPERFRAAHRGHRSSYLAAPRTRPMGLGLELAARRRDGSEFPVEIGLSHAETEAGRVAMAFVTDVTERHALERASRHAERLTALGTLAAGVAHELNNPVGIMSSRIELMLLEGDALPAAVREDLEALHRNTVRVTQITHRLLSFARQPGGERRVLDINALVLEALALVQSQIDRDGVHVRTELADELPGVHGEPTALHQVLVNLLINAKEAMTAGEIAVRTRRAPEGGWIALTVADTGPGIAPEVLARIFDPFYTTKPTGTGLGLAISYGIVREHHGRIDVESVPGQGTTFVITLPSVTGEGPHA